MGMCSSFLASRGFRQCIHIIYKNSLPFSSTTNIEQNLSTLIHMVQEPYLQKRLLKKRKGLLDRKSQCMMIADWRVYFGLIENLFHSHPVKIDIAGTIESISHITADLLYLCYNTFYHPSNMLFFVTGPVDPEKSFLSSVKTRRKSNSNQPRK